MKQNELFNKCCENIDPKTREEVWKQMDKELGRTELEQAAAEYADKHGFRVPYDGSNNFYDDVDVKASLEGFKAGAKWMAEQGITYKDKVMPTTDNSGNIDGYCLDGENEFAVVKAAVENGYLKVGDKVIVQIRKAE